MLAKQSEQFKKIFMYKKPKVGPDINEAYNVATMDEISDSVEKEVLRKRKNSKTFYWRNQKQILKKRKDSYKKNREAMQTKANAYYEKNKETLNKRSRDFYHKNHKKELARASNYYYRMKNLFKKLTTPYLLQNYHAKKYNGHLFPEIEKRKTHKLLLRSFKGKVIWGNKNRVLLPKGFKPFKFPVFENQKPVSMLEAGAHYGE